MNVLSADSASGIRLGLFLLVFLILAMSEVRWPRRQLTAGRSQRWAANIGLSFFNSFAIKTLIPFSGVVSSLWAQEQGFGLFNQLGWSGWFEFLLFILLFDLTIYWQHRVFHMLPVLWRFHRVHHTDEDYDLTTGTRFHPISILISTILKIGLVIVSGASPLAILSAEIILNLTSMFNHSNICLPKQVDRVLRKIVVTPDMHRIHHSQEKIEHNCNFGFNFSFWDRFFGSYLQDSGQAQENMAIGIVDYQGSATRSLFSLFLQPFRSERSARTKRS
ncbi:sterol desaturase family protein [Gammaproteobacteria bacterium]|jgi:sterol desaturase/sphingolipid hydroxylase (fatty acid hydroxylase superfamily)|nr:sterol desaturase family protein [Gammaproteobacteria bacterium]MDA8601784.1 sterol desaturase family protein [Gammaproteobacteria bacterium]MDA8672856.1 sterol desaturase family protein [Gammaproteobacteria bacterium]MDA9578855.1 sterol desaturase family protein [Gammaproteobacteria bacterium]MDB2504892.1 sterol desaturase family protein [Gammaproteobacteria bacterium]